jgi:hypothetical protein
MHSRKFKMPKIKNMRRHRNNEGTQRRLQQKPK